MRVTARVLAAALAGAGCSTVFSRPPPTVDEPGDCSRSYLPPALDSAWVGLQGVTLAALLSHDDWLRGNPTERTTAIVASAVQMSVFGASALYGYQAALRCREAEAATARAASAR